MNNFLLIGSLVFFASAEPKLNQDYAQMMMKDLEEFHGMVDSLVRSSKNEQKEVELLVEATMVLMSRPDEDSAIGKIWPKLHSTLKSRKLFKKVIPQAVKESIARAKLKDQPVAMQATYLYVLTNMVAYFGAHARFDETAKHALESIRSSNIKVPEAVQREGRMRTMRKTVSPSKIAAAKLAQLFPANK